MTRPFNTCESCGADPFKTQDYDKVVKEREQTNYWYKKFSAEHALEKAEWRIKEISLTESMKDLQRKVVKQAKVITRLENKLKKFKQLPYKEEGPDEFTVRSMDGKLVIMEKGKNGPDEPLPVR